MEGWGVSMVARRAIPIVGLILTAYVVFGVAWTLTEPLRVVAPTPTRTPQPTYTPISADEMLVAVTPSPSPTSTRTVQPSATATPTRTPTPTATPGPQFRQHLVQSGDTLLGIAAQYDVAYEALLDANRLADADVLFVGQALTVPHTLTLPLASVRQHMVELGDTMLGIAVKYGVDYDSLLQINGIARPDLIYEGQVLTVPEE